MFGGPRPTRTTASNQRSPPQTPRTPVTQKSTPTSPPPVTSSTPKLTLNSSTPDVDDTYSAREKPESNPLQTSTPVDREDPSPQNTRDPKPRNPLNLNVNTGEKEVDISLKPHVTFVEDTKDSKTRKLPPFQTANDNNHLQPETVPKDTKETKQGPLLSTGGRVDRHDPDNEHVGQSLGTARAIRSRSKARFGFTRPLDFWKWNFINKLKGKCRCDIVC